MDSKREALKKKYGSLFDSISALLFEADPMSISTEENPDEYEPEVATIMPRLSMARSVEDVRAIVYEEFSHWFGEGTAGPLDRYDAVSAQIWELWRAHQQPGG